MIINDHQHYHPHHGSGGAGWEVQGFANDGKDGGGEDAGCDRLIIITLLAILFSFFYSQI